MDNLFQSWTQPVPESRDPRPVFPPEVTMPIEAALSKVRGIDERSRQAAEASRMQKAHPFPQQNGGVHQLGRVSTPNAPQYVYPPPHASQPPQGYSSIPPPPYPSHQTHVYPPVVPSPVPQILRSPIQQNTTQIHRYPTPQQAPNGSAQFIYSGPPPSSLSHQARLDKLRLDTQGLLESCRAHLSLTPNDAKKQHMLQNLQSLRALIDQGSLSLTHIQSTEVVIANLARELPPLPPQAMGSVPTQALFNPAAIASILARSNTQQTPLPSAPGSQYAPPAAPQPQFTPAFPVAPPAMPPTAAAPVSMAQIMSILGTAASPAANQTPLPPPVAHHTANAAPAMPTSSLLEQLRASGLLGTTPVQGTPTQVPATPSYVPQILQAQPVPNPVQATMPAYVVACSLGRTLPYVD